MNHSDKDNKRRAPKKNERKFGGKKNESGTPKRKRNRKTKEQIREDSKRERDALISKAVNRACGGKPDSEVGQWIRGLLEKLLSEKSIPIELLEDIPSSSSIVGKNRIDQLIDAVLFLAYPNYSEDLEDVILGEGHNNPGIKLWRVILPPEYKIYSLLIRANSYQQAFARAADYVCRRYILTHGRPPVDIHIQIKYFSESEARVHYAVRRVNRRRASKLRAEKNFGKYGSMKVSDKQLYGARMAGLGSPSDPDYRTIRYIAHTDQIRMNKVEEGRQQRISQVELETFVDTAAVPEDVKIRTSEE